MDTSKPTYIEKVEIKGLWGRFDVNWDLNADVNILVGENGTGKSTILRIIKEHLDINSKATKMALNNDKSIQTWVKSKFDKFFDKVTIFSKKEKIELLTSEVVTDFSSGKPFNYVIKGSTISKQIGEKNVSYISTFDNNLVSKDDISKISNNRVKTDLDIELFILEKSYSDFLLNQLSPQKGAEDLFRKRKSFINILNNLFSETNKKVNESINHISFLIEEDLRISPYQLSSGEKQLLVILLTVLVQDEQPSILIMDEPEISLHIRWQHELIEIIRTLNPNCQLIIATHSPSMFNDGHREKVFWMEDIVSTSKTGEV